MKAELNNIGVVVFLVTEQTIQGNIRLILITFSINTLNETDANVTSGVLYKNFLKTIFFRFEKFSKSYKC